MFRGLRTRRVNDVNSSSKASMLETQEEPSVKAGKDRDTGSKQSGRKSSPLLGGRSAVLSYVAFN